MRMFPFWRSDTHNLNLVKIIYNDSTSGWKKEVRTSQHSMDNIFCTEFDCDKTSRMKFYSVQQPKLACWLLVMIED